MAENGPNRKLSASLVALSSAAIITVYAAGYLRTKPAADRFDLEAAARRRRPPPPRVAAAPGAYRSLPVAAAAAAAPAAPAPTTLTPPEPAPSAPAPLQPAPPKLLASASPKPTAVALPSASPSPSPSATPRPAPAKAATPSPAPTSSAEVPAPAASAEPAAASPVEPAIPLVEEAPEGDTAPAGATLPSDQYVDGIYTGWGSCRHGDLQVELTVQGGRIAWASIAKCYTRYPCSWVDGLVPEVVAHQGPPVTFISGASDSSDALFYAVLDALSKAK